MGKTHAPYSFEFRRRMLELVRTGRRPAELAREFEVSIQSVRNWVCHVRLGDGVALLYCRPS